jgi:hypothetical protein
MTSKPEHQESLWWLIVSPTIWALHFLASYITAALWCEKAVGRAGPLGGARAAIVAYTIVALSGVLATGWMSYRRHRFGRSPVPHDEDTPEDRHRFLGFATFLLSLLSAVAIVYVALPTLFIGTCR